MAIYDRICQTCGASFKGGPRSWYCPNCRTDRRRERQRRYQKDGYSRHIGDTDICKNCGAEYTISSGLQMYCEECQKEMHMQLDRKQSLAYYEEHRDEINPTRNERRRVPERKCVICGKLFNPKGRGQSKTCSAECQADYREFLRKAIYNRRSHLDYASKKKKTDKT